MKILIIANFFYPENTPRAFRTTELALELRRIGYDITVALPNKGIDYTDYCKENNIKIEFFGKELKTNNTNIFKKIRNRLLFEIFDYPDIKLLFQVKRYLANRKFNAIISIAYPHTIHFGVAASINGNITKVWIADCGDPFMGNPIVKRFFYFKYLEKFFCKKVDYITIPIESGRDAYYEEYRNKIKIIPQGFDFSKIKLEEYKPNKILTFVYAGTFYKGTRDPSLLLDYLSKLDIEFKFIIYTETIKILEPYINLLKNKLIIKKPIERSKLLIELSKADFLINIKNNSILQTPSKLIDYKLANRPVLDVDSHFFDEKFVEEFFQQDYKNGMRIPDLKEYDIRNITKKFIDLIDERLQDR